MSNLVRRARTYGVQCDLLHVVAIRARAASPEGWLWAALRAAKCDNRKTFDENTSKVL